MLSERSKQGKACFDGCEAQGEILALTTEGKKTSFKDVYLRKEVVMKAEAKKSLPTVALSVERTCGKVAFARKINQEPTQGLESLLAQ